MDHLTEETMKFFLSRHEADSRWKDMDDYDVDQLIIKHMTRGEKIEFLDVNCPNEMDEFFKGGEKRVNH